VEPMAATILPVRTSGALPGAAFISYDKLERDTDKLGNWRVLGAGAFGKVYAACYIGEDVAVKHIDVESSLCDADKAVFLREAGHQFCIRHPHIVPLLKVVVDETDTPPFYALIMPRMPQSLQG